MFLAALSEFGTCDIIAEGQSMFPFIRSGDLVTVAAPVDAVRCGDVVAVFSDSQLILHRVIQRMRRSDGTPKVRIAGDSSPRSVAIVELHEIIGTVGQVKRSGICHRWQFQRPGSLLAIPLGFFLRTAANCSHFFHAFSLIRPGRIRP